jgi:hypothetical protein
MLSSVRPSIRFHERVDVELLGAARPLALAVAQHGDAVGDLEDLVEPVADIDDGLAGRGELLDHVEDADGIGFAERCGRLVQNE